MSFVHAAPPFAPFLMMHIPYDTDDTVNGKLPDAVNRSKRRVSLSTLTMPFASIRPVKLPFERDGLAVNTDL